LNRFVFGKWQCVSRELDIMKKSLTALEGLKKGNIFKIKEDRIIFKFCIDGKWYFAKKNIPKRLKEIIKEIFRPQSKIEYNAGLLLDSLGVAVVNMIGWARNKTISIIISESPRENVITAMDFWNKRAISDKNAMHRFLVALAEFIRTFFNANLIHPDLHFGNLLVIEEDSNLKLIVVDPFGIRLFRGMKYDIFKGGFALLLYGLQWYLDRNEKISFFIDSHLIEKESEFDVFWGKIIKFVARHQIKEWSGGRRRKFLTRCTRGTEKSNEQNGNVMFLRKGIDGNPLFSKDELNTAGLAKEETKKAKQRWLFSLYLQTFGIDHVRAIAWEKVTNGQDVLFCENEKEFLPYKESEYLKDFLQICEFAGLKVKNPSQDILFRGEIPCLKNCTPDYWGKKGL
jgi:hypothetical protein